MRLEQCDRCGSWCMAHTVEWHPKAPAAKSWCADCREWGDSLSRTDAIRVEAKTIGQMFADMLLLILAAIVLGLFFAGFGILGTVF